MALSMNKKKLLSSSRYGISLSAIIMSLTIMPAVSGAVPIKQNLDPMHAAEQLGFSKKNKDFSYDKIERSAGSVTYYGVKQGTELKADKLTINNQEETGKLRVAFEGINSTQTDTSVSMGNLNIIYSDITASTKLPDVIDIQKNNNLNFDISGQDVKILTGKFPASVSQFAVNDVNVANGNVKFKNLHVRDFAGDFVVMRLKVGGVDIDGINDNLFAILNSFIDNNANSDVVIKNNLNNVAMNLFSISDVEIHSSLLNDNNNGKPNRFDGLKLGRFEVAGLTADKLKTLAFNDFDLSGLLLGDDLKLKVGEFSFNDLNLLYYKSVIGALSGDKSLLDKTIAEILPKGPLSAANNLRLKDVYLLGSGAKFTIDNLGLTPTYDSADILTNISLPRANIGLEVTNKNAAIGSAVQKFLTYWGVDALHASVEGNANYSPSEGTIELSGNRIHVDKMGEINAAAKVSGVNEFLHNIKLSELATAYKPFLSDDSEAKTIDDVKAIINVYRDFNLVSADIAYNDLGLLNNIALSQAVGRAKTVKAIRKEWAKSFYDFNKSKQLNHASSELINAIGKLAENGKEFRITYSPQTPIPLGAFIDKSSTAKDLGQTITVR